MNHAEFLAITCTLLKAREKSRVQGAIGFGFASHWLKPGAGFFSQLLRVAIAMAQLPSFENYSDSFNDFIHRQQREKGRTRVHKLSNVATALRELKKRNVSVFMLAISLQSRSNRNSSLFPKVSSLGGQSPVSFSGSFVFPPHLL